MKIPDFWEETATREISFWRDSARNWQATAKTMVSVACVLTCVLAASVALNISLLIFLCWRS